MTSIPGFRSSRLFHTSLLLACVIAGPHRAFSDTLRLASGESREGIVVSASHAFITITTPEGEERYPVASITGITLSASDWIVTAPGDTIRCKILSSTPEGILIVLSSGSRELRRDSITATLYNVDDPISISTMPMTGDLFRPTSPPPWKQALSLSRLEDRFAGVDSLLARGQRPAARDSLDGVQRYLLSIHASSSWSEDLVGEYRATISLLETNARLPDSVSERYCENIERFRANFIALHSGRPATEAFEQAIELRESGLCTLAYERYLLARFFQARHTRRERQRLLSNLEELRGAMDRREYQTAGSLVNRYREELPTMTFLRIKDTLDRAYIFIEKDLRQVEAKQRFESRRVQLSPSASFLAGVGLVPLVAVEYAQLLFLDPATGQPARVAEEETALKLSVVQIWGEASVYLTRRLVVGVTFGYWSVTGSGSFFTESRQAYSFPVRLKGAAVGGMVKYLFDTRTAFRPYAGLHAGYTRWVLSPDYRPEDPKFIAIVEIADSRPRYAGELGSDYIPSEGLPIQLNGFVSFTVYPEGDANLLPSTQFTVGLRLGAWF